MPSTASSALSADSIVACEPARSVLSVCRFVMSPPNVEAAARQRSSSAMLPGSWMTQIALVTPASVSCSPGGLAGDGLALADVGDGPEVLPVVDAGVDRDDRDAGVDGGADGGLETVGVGHGDDEPAGAVGHRVVDQGALLARVGRRSCSGRRCQVLAGPVAAGLDDVPERVAGRGVGDDVDADVLGRRAAAAATAASVSLAAALAAATVLTGAAAREHERARRDAHGENPSDLHGVPPCRPRVADCDRCLVIG